MFRKISVAVVLAFALLSAAPAASPVQITYVDSDSMTPTIGVDDGVVLVPAGHVEEGDIVTFRAEKRPRPTTHRVVGRADRGFLTKGDANAVTDQTVGYTYVTREEIVGEVLTVAGRPVVLPNLGVLVEFLRTHRLAAIVLSFAAAIAVGTGRNRPERSVMKARSIVALAYVVLGATLVALVFFGGTTATVSFVVTAAGVGGSTTMTVGEPLTTSLTLTGVTESPFTYTLVRTHGMTIVERQWFGRALEVVVRIPAQAHPGVQMSSFSVYQYPKTLPQSVVVALHSIHPVLAAAGTIATVLTPSYLLTVLLVDGSVRVRRTRSRISSRLRRLFGRRSDRPKE